MCVRYLLFSGILIYSDDFDNTGTIRSSSDCGNRNAHSTLKLLVNNFLKTQCAMTSPVFALSYCANLVFLFIRIGSKNG